jgi:hypothetical protein
MSPKSPRTPLIPSPSKPRSARALAGRALRQTALAALVLACALGTVATVAQATPVDVYFDGPTSSSVNYGISLASATNARDNFGVAIIDQTALLTTLGGRLSVIQPPSSELVATPNPPTSSNNHILSNWQIENTSGAALTGASYLVFTNARTYTVGDKTIDYVDSNVGLRIDRDLGWAIIKSTTSGVDYYYPALLLDRTASNPLLGNIASGARVSAAINYLVAEPLTRANGDYRLPSLNLGYALVVVPEPGTALLFGAGLALLAGRRDRTRAR